MPMPAVLFDTRALFESFSAGAMSVHDGVRVVPLERASKHQGLLVEEDRGVDGR
jgi:hypothetical protein